ncbi:histidine--tRNA ligase [Candidatus Gracilibacteria bacterium]|nr:histidine--tRNA ligase [Candidatus Gracilibacteria bacterium]
MESTVEHRLSGTYDLFPEDHVYHTFLKKVFRHEFRKNGFRRISTPLFEETSLLRKVYPENNNNYGLYRFHNKDDIDVSLLPSATVGVMRAYLENEKQEELQPLYYYYMERCFRQDRKRKEYYAIGGEIIGESDPIIDAQSMYMMHTGYKKIGLTGVKLQINCYGKPKEMEKYFEELVAFLENKRAVMSEKLSACFESDPLELFRSTDEDDQILAGSAPSIMKFLKKDSKKYYADLKGYLDDLGIEYTENPKLFFSETFYTGVIWSFENQEGKNLGTGGRYDLLAGRLGSPKEYGASGFSIDTMNIVDMLKNNNISIKNKDTIDLYFVQLGEEAKKVVFPLSLEARERGINTQTSLGTPSMKEQMLKATRIGAKYVVLVAVMEARSGVFQVRNMEAGTQAEIPKDKLIDYIIEKTGEENLDFYEPSRDLLEK